jgi:hypothetical protein
MKFNQEQLIAYMNMEAQYKEMTKAFEVMTTGEERAKLEDAEYADLCRRYTYATIQMIKMRSWVRDVQA